MKEVMEKAMGKRYIRIEVIDPVTITTKEHFGWTSSVTTYLIKIQTNHWAFSLKESEVRRRFSEFCWLRSKLIQHHPNKRIPPLPPKKFLHLANFHPKILQERCDGLEKFIQRLLRSYVLLSDAALHLFLQSEATIDEIEEQLNHEINRTPIKRLFPSSLFQEDTKSLSVDYHRSISSSNSTNSAGEAIPSSDDYSSNDERSHDDEDMLISSFTSEMLANPSSLDVIKAS